MGENPSTVSDSRFESLHPIPFTRCQNIEFTLAQLNKLVGRLPKQIEADIRSYFCTWKRSQLFRSGSMKGRRLVQNILS